jgi:histidine phosphotransfer protein HptB
MIDWQQARQLQHDVGKDEMAEVVELFISEVDEAIGVLQKDYPQMSTQDRAAAFHFLKGCAANLGFKAFGAQCAKGEEITQKGEEPDFQVSDIVEVYEKSKRQFAKGYEAELV